MMRLLYPKNAMNANCLNELAVRAIVARIQERPHATVQQSYAHPNELECEIAKL